MQSPENSLHTESGLLALVARAGPGDSLRVEQFNVQHWGSSASTPDEDPNLRLAAYLAAARRGAQVRILLDRYYADRIDPQGNFATEAYVNALAPAEGLDLAARLGSPARLGIHNKMVLAQIAGDALFLNRFGRRISVNGNQRCLADHCHRAGVRITCHQFRHTFGRHMTEARMPVTSRQRLFGHERLRSTMIYVHIHDPDVQADFLAAAEKIDRRLRG